MATRRYEPDPRYAPVGGEVCAGWDGAVADLPDGPYVLALDGPALLPWERAVDEVCAALHRRGSAFERLDLRDSLVPWPDVVAATTSPALADDPDFERLAGRELRELFAELPPARPPASGVLVAYGPGAALLSPDRLWWLDLPKRFAEAEVSAGRGHNLGQRSADGPPTTRRLFYVDWPLTDRHRDAVAAQVHRWVDLQDPDRPTSLDGATLRATMRDLAGRPFRTRPTFNTTPWGGHWAQRRLGVNPDAPNTALGYELIAPESGVLVGSVGDAVEVPFQLVVAAHPTEVLGPDVHDMFGTSFPVRFDYLDTVDGGHLSVHCHPQADYMAEVFGWPYTQHETYYVMVAGPQSRVFLGLREDADVAGFRRWAAEAEAQGVPLDIERFVQVHPAEPHQLFLIPAGTPHGSGVGNVVLEVSATPYLYSLRFYDWLRRDAAGGQRPVHVGHAFRNLDPARTGAAVRRDLVPPPQTVHAGETAREELLGSLPEMFFEVRRVDLDPGGVFDDDTAGRFHILTVVEGDGVRVEPVAGAGHGLAYAETLVVPAAVGGYRLHGLGDERARAVKAVVR
jgi:mannose-6-phosphate isomerase class I